MADGRRWMEGSLRRSSELGREVLERAQRRDPDWWSACREEGRLPGTQCGMETPEEEERRGSLEEALNTLSHFMRCTTEHCERYHRCIPVREMDGREKQHVHQYHCRKSQQMMQRPESRVSSGMARPQSGGRMKVPRDVYIEVSPGTYSISAGSRNCQTQTHVVNIPPGQSVDLTFNV